MQHALRTDIIYAIQHGGGADPATNQQLAAALRRAREHHMPQSITDEIIAHAAGACTRRVRATPRHITPSTSCAPQPRKSCPIT